MVRWETKSRAVLSAALKAATQWLMWTWKRFTSQAEKRPARRYEKWYFYWSVGCVYLAIDTNFSLFSAVMTSRVSLSSDELTTITGLKANACWQSSWHNSKAVIVFITFPSRSHGLSARLLNINYRRRRQLIIVLGDFTRVAKSERKCCGSERHYRAKN